MSRHVVCRVPLLAGGGGDLHGEYCTLPVTSLTTPHEKKQTTDQKEHASGGGRDEAGTSSHNWHSAAN